MKSRILSATALATVAALALAGCSSPAAEEPNSTPGTSGTAASTRGELLTLGIVQEPASWDPAQAHVGHRLQPFQAAYDSLILRAPDGSYEPMLATEWGYTDETNLVFSLDMGPRGSIATACRAHNLHWLTARAAGQPGLEGI